MTQTLDAVFEDGSFRPAQGDLLELAGKVYEGLSEKEIDEVERIALDRASFFQDRPAS